MDPSAIDRRSALALLGASALSLPAAPAAAAIRTDVLTVLYRPATATAPSRLDPAVQAAMLALEEEFLQRGFRVLQPKPEVYALMDRGPGVVVTFADDAGFSAVFSAYRNLRPQPGQEAGIAESVCRCGCSWAATRWWRTKAGVRCSRGSMQPAGSSASVARWSSRPGAPRPRWPRRPRSG